MRNSSSNKLRSAAAVRVIVDENVGTDSLLWLAFQQQLGGRFTDFVFLKEVHPGIPDVEIIDKVLTQTSVLLTGDCALHQKAIAAGFRSYTLNEHGDLTKKRLRGIRPPKSNPHSVHLELKADYRYQETIVGRCLKATLTDRGFKRLRTARRRSRSHFGSADAIGEVSATIGSISTRKGLLCGYVHRIAGNSGVKGLRANEGYCVATDSSENAALPLIFALRQLFLLQLDQTRVKVFILSPTMRQLANTLMNSSEPPTSPTHCVLQQMMNSLKHIEVYPCVKGPFFDELDQKFKRLEKRWGNEVKTIDFDVLTNQVVSGLPNADDKAIS